MTRTAKTKAAAKAKTDNRPAPSQPTRKVVTRRITWRHTTLKVRHTQNTYVDGTDHIEVFVIEPKGAPIPITDTGYRSHFLPGYAVTDAGSATAFVTAWLDELAKGKDWAVAEQRWRQRDLFTAE